VTAFHNVKLLLHGTCGEPFSFTTLTLHTLQHIKINENGKIPAHVIAAERENEKEEKATIQGDIVYKYNPSLPVFRAFL